MNEEERRVADLYGRLPKPQPSAALDAAVLAAARAAVASAAPAIAAPATAARQRPRWFVPLSAAASALLAVGVGWRLGQEESVRSWPESPARTAAAPAAVATSDVGTAAQLDQAAGKTADDGAAGTGATDAPSPITGKDQEAQAFPAQPPAAPPAPAAMPAEASPMALGKSTPPAEPEVAAEAATEAYSVAAEPAPPPAAESMPADTRADADSKSSAAASATMRDEPIRMEEAQSMPAKQEGAETEHRPGSTAEGGRQLPALPIRGEPPPGTGGHPERMRSMAAERRNQSDAQGPAQSEDSSAREAPAASTSGLRSSQEFKRDAAPPAVLGRSAEKPGAAAMHAKPAPALEISGTHSDLIVDADRTEPGAWLRAIQRLKDANRLREARAELRRFVEQHPAYPLSADFTALLKSSD